MGFLKIDRSKPADENFLYLKFFVDLEGNPIYAKRIREEQEDEQQSFRKNVLKIDDYQTHPDLAVDIVKNNQELNALWNELKKEFIDLYEEPYWFLIFYGYVCVDAIDNTHDFVRYDSATTPRKQIQEMNADDPYELHFDREDWAEEDRWTNKNDFQKLQELHKIILERRKNKTTNTEREDGEER